MTYLIRYEYKASGWFRDGAVIKSEQRSGKCLPSPRKQKLPEQQPCVRSKQPLAAAAGRRSHGEARRCTLHPRFRAQVRLQLLTSEWTIIMVITLLAWNLPLPFRVTCSNFSYLDFNIPSHASIPQFPNILDFEKFCTKHCKLPFS